MVSACHLEGRATANRGAEKALGETMKPGPGVVIFRPLAAVAWAYPLNGTPRKPPLPIVALSVGSHCVRANRQTRFETVPMSVASRVVRTDLSRWRLKQRRRSSSLSLDQNIKAPGLSADAKSVSAAGFVIVKCRP